jgi:hypothetical protein
MDSQSAQVPEHPPRRAPAAQGNKAATALRARTADLGARPLDGTLGCDFGGRKHMDAHTAENESCGLLERQLFSPEDRRDYGVRLLPAARQDTCALR